MVEQVPADVLEFLHARPQIQLHRILRFRHVGLDSVTLSSPLLHTLDIALSTNHETEFLALRDGLFKAKRLKHLTLRLQPGAATQFFPPGEGMGPQLTSDEILPALESLTLDGRDWNWHDLLMQECRLWVPIIDWSKLRKLDIAHATSVDQGPNRLLLSALIGRVGGLESLRLGFRPDHSYGHTVRFTPWASQTDIDDLRRLLESIDALQEFELFTGESVYCVGLEPSIVQTHGSSLKKLVVRLGMREGWDATKFNDLRRYAPQLEELEVPVEMYQEGGVRKAAPAAVSRDTGTGLRQRLSSVWQRQKDAPPTARSVWPTRTHFILMSFPRLRHLRLRVQLRSDSSQFTPDARSGTSCSIIKEMAEETVTRLFKESRRLESLAVVFRFVEPSVVTWTFTVERRWMPEFQQYRTVLGNSTTGEVEELQRAQERVFDPYGGID